MRQFLLIIALCATLGLCGGCDFLRSVAGRPTSEQLAASKAEAEKAEAARAAALKARAEYEEASRKFGESGIKIARASEYQWICTEALTADFYIVVGTFRRESNANALFKTLTDAGYSPVIIPYKDGRRAVASCAAGTLPEAWAGLEKVRFESFCPADVWMIDSRK